MRLWKQDGSGQLQYFRQRRLPKAHSATDYPRWMGALQPYLLSAHDVSGMCAAPDAFSSSTAPYTAPMLLH